MRLVHRHRRQLGRWHKAWKKNAPTATHVVEYKERDTRTKKLVGKEATELSTEKYGKEEWWLLLDPIG